MDKIKALEVVEGLHQLAASIETLAKAIQAGEEVPMVKAETPDPEPISIVKVRAVLAEKSQSGKQPEVKALITKYGADKLTDIDPVCYLELLKEAEAI